MSSFFMKIKCLFSHDWDIWQESILNRYVSQKDKIQYRICTRCYKQQNRPYPPLEDRMLAALETRDHIRIYETFQALKRDYGVLAFNKAAVNVAQKHFYIALRWSKEEIIRRLVRYYTMQVLDDKRLAC